MLVQDQRRMVLATLNERAAKKGFPRSGFDYPTKRGDDDEGTGALD